MLVATLLALVAACLHATWNLLVKTSGDRFLAAWAQFLAGSALFLPVLLVIGLPNWQDAVPHLIGSGLVHVLYLGCLVRSYHHGDFGLAYPMARGIGALGATVGGVLLLDDVIARGAWIGIAVVVAGLIWLVVPIEPEAAGWAALTGLCIGMYTTIDSAGARLTDGFAYGIAISLSAALALSVVGLARGRASDLVAQSRVEWKRYLAAGFCLTLAYSLVLIAVRQPGVPVGYVALLRESSVVIGAGLGWLLLKEDMGRKRLVASGVVAAGLVLLVLLRDAG